MFFINTSCIPLSISSIITVSPSKAPINALNCSNILLVPADSILEGIDFISPPIIL